MSESGRELIPAAQKDDAFLADVDAARSGEESVHVWWLGQSGFLVQWLGRHLLFDPYLSDSLTRKYAATDKPHVRMSERVVAPDRLDFVDIVSSSHNHTDHLDGETLTAIRRASKNLEILVPSANREFAAERLGVAPDSLRSIDAGEKVTIGAFELHAVPAAHEELERDEHGRYRYLGYVARFGPWSVYHSGDTILYDGMVEWLRPFGVDLAFLPINGRAPERRVAGNLWGREAAELAHAIGAKSAIPCHYDMFTFNTATPEEFVRRCDELGQDYRVLEGGARCSFSSRGGS